MKYLLFAIILISSAQAQVWRKEPEKRDNAVRLVGVSFQTAVHKLIVMNYRIDKIDSNYKTVQVNIGEHQTMYLRADTGQNIIVRSDLYLEGNMCAQHSPILWWKSSFNRAYWDVMMKYVNAFPDVEYAKL